MTTAYIDGIVQIGDPATPPLINVPVKATIPPVTPGVFVFDYTATSVEDATKINIVSFLAWLLSAVNVDIPVADLPEGLRTLTIAVKRFYLDTVGKFEFDILIGSTNADNKWVPEWKPVPSLQIVLVDFGLGVGNMASMLAEAGLAVAARPAGMSIAGMAPNLVVQRVGR